MSVVVSLEAIEEARRIKLCLTDAQIRRGTPQPSVTKRGGKLGKRPVGVRKSKGRVGNSESFNQGLLSRSPGSSRNTGLDFVKAVYAATTGQEPM